MSHILSWGDSVIALALSTPSLPSLELSLTGGLIVTGDPISSLDELNTGDQSDESSLVPIVTEWLLDQTHGTRNCEKEERGRLARESHQGERHLCHRTNQNVSTGE